MKGNKKGAQASITVEAALVVPIFLYCVMGLIYLMVLFQTEEKVAWALQEVGNEVAVEYVASEKKPTLNPVYFTAKMNGYLRDGSVPVSLLRSKYDEKKQLVTFVCDYGNTVPFPIVKDFFLFSRKHTVRLFSGVKTRNREEDGDEMVYITPTGRVFHRSTSCKYLALHISQVKGKDLGFLRSEGGSIYYPCEACCTGECGPEENVFICSYGDRYHRSRSCSKLKRSIRRVKRAQVPDRVPCSNCGNQP